MKRFWAGLLAWGLMLTLCAFALAEETKLTVTGNGSVTVTADCVTITLGVEETAKEVAEAQNSVNTRINAETGFTMMFGLNGDGSSSEETGTTPDILSPAGEPALVTALRAMEGVA